MLLDRAQQFRHSPIEREYLRRRLNPELQRRPVRRCNRAQRIGLQRGRIGAMKHLDHGALDGREVRDKRRAFAHRMVAQIRREMSSAVVERRLGRRIFEQVAGDQVVKIVVAEHSQRRRKILLERVEQPVEIHVRVNINASFRRQALVAEYNIVESARAQRALRREPLGDAARRGDQPVEQAFQFF